MGEGLWGLGGEFGGAGVGEGMQALEVLGFRASEAL